MNNCIEWGMSQKMCCSGCVQFADRLGLLIDDRDHDALMAEALATRATKHTHRDKQCLQLWKKPSNTLTTKEHKRLWQLQCDFIVERGFDPQELRLPTITTAVPATASVTRRLDYATLRSTPRLPYTGNQNAQWQSPTVNPPTGTVTTTSTSTSTSMADATMADAPSAPPTVTDIPSTPPTASANTTNGQPDEDGVITSPAKNRNVNMLNRTITSNKKEYSYDIPATHTIVTVKYLSQLKREREALKTLKGQTKLKRWTKNASEIVTKFLAFALAAAPGMAITALGYVLPMMVAGFLHHYELYDHIGKEENFPSCFPSESTLRNTITN